MGGLYRVTPTRAVAPAAEASRRPGCRRDASPFGPVRVVAFAFTTRGRFDAQQGISLANAVIVPVTEGAP